MTVILGLDEAKGRPMFALTDPARLGPALAAANAWVAERCRVDDPPQADLVQSVAQLTLRYLARESSPEGFVGTSETGGTAYIGRVDQDVMSLIGPHRRVVFA